MDNTIDDTNAVGKSVAPEVSPKNKEYFKLFRWRVRRKIALYVVAPLIVLLLVFYGFARQGFVGDWFNSFKKASLTLTIVDEKSAALAGAQIIISDKTATTDEKGVVRIDGLISGKQSLTIRRSGYLPSLQEITLKRGENALGNITLKETPVAKVNLTLAVTDYISEEAIRDATVKLGELTPIYQDGGYLFNTVPIGKYTLATSKTGYNSFSTEVVLDKDSKVLPAIALTPTGRVVFESNRDRGRRGIFSADYDGTDQKSIVSRVGDFEDYYPRLGPNQRKVFFSSTRDGEKLASGNAYQPYLYVVDIDGNNLKKVAKGESGSSKWSPDGGYIGLYNNDYANNQFKLYLYDVTTNTLATVAARSGNSGYFSEFAFSPDSKKLAFSGYLSDDPSNQRGVYYQTIGQDTKMIDGSTGGSSVAFSAEGKIRYQKYVNNKTLYYQFDPATGTQAEYTPAIADDTRFSLVASPDKKWTAYLSRRDGKTNVFISDAEDKNERQLTTAGGVSGNIVWSKNSQFLTFDYATQSETTIDVVSINGVAFSKKVVDVSGVYNYGYY